MSDGVKEKDRNAISDVKLPLPQDAQTASHRLGPYSRELHRRERTKEKGSLVAKQLAEGRERTRGSRSQRRDREGRLQQGERHLN